MTPSIPALRAALAAAKPYLPLRYESGFIRNRLGFAHAEAPDVAETALIVAAVNALPGLLDRLEAQKKVLDLVRETEAPGGHHRLRRLHEELEDAWTALERLEAPDGR